jgi:hypothetical protein
MESSFGNLAREITYEVKVESIATGAINTFHFRAPTKVDVIKYLGSAFSQHTREQVCFSIQTIVELVIPSQKKPTFINIKNLDSCLPKEEFDSISNNPNYTTVSWN